MALDNNLFRNWVDGEVFSARDYVYERNLIINYINGLPTVANVLAAVAEDFYTKTQLNDGQLDNRYFTQTELKPASATQGAAELDSRYFVKSSVTDLVVTERNRINALQLLFANNVIPNVLYFNQPVLTTSQVEFVSVTLGTKTLTQQAITVLEDKYTQQQVDENFINQDQLGVPEGVATLDEFGKLDPEQVPVNIVVFRGTFGSATSTTQGDLPLEAIQGDFYICDTDDFESAVAFDSENNPITFDNGDKAVYTGTSWSKIDNNETVTGVKGEAETIFRIGEVSISKDDIGLSNVTNNAQVTSVTGQAPIASTGGLTPQISIANVTTTTDGAMTFQDKVKLDGIADNANNYVHPNHSGDVTSIGDGATTITDKAVTLAKMADLPAETIIGNNLEEAGTPVGLTMTQVRALADLYTKGEVDTALGLKIDTDARGAVNGVASLNGDGKVPASQLPSFVDDVLEFVNLAAFPETGETGKIYVAKDTNRTYRWSGSAYIEIAANAVLSVNNKTDAVVLTGEDIDIDAVDVDVDASGFTKILNTDDINVQLALEELDQHTHVESDITNLNKYTQQEVNALLAAKADVSALSASITLYPTTAPSAVSGYFTMVTDVNDVRYNDVAFNFDTGVISQQNQLLGSLATDENIFVGNPGVINITTIGNIRKTSGNTNQFAEFFFRIYQRKADGTENLLGTSETTGQVNPVNNNVYFEFSANSILNNGEFEATDRIVVKYFANALNNSTVSRYDFQFGGATPVRTLLPVPVRVLQSAEKIFYNNDVSGLQADNVQDAVDALEQLIQENTTVIKVQKFEILQADNGSGGFTYTYADGPASVTGTKSSGAFVFPLRDDVVYIPNNNRVEAKVNNDITFYFKDSELIEVDQETVAIDYTLQDGDEVFFKVYQGLDSVALVVPDGSITTQKLSAPLQGKITDYDTHIASTANPHNVTASQIGLANVTNDAQVKKAASSTDGHIPKWSGTTGDAIVDGYGVQTTLSSSTTDLVRADAIFTAIDAVDQAKQDTLVSGTNIKTILNQSVLGSGNIEIDIPAVTVAPAPPDIQTANDGDLWFNSINSILYIAYDDLQGTPSKQWVQVSFVALQEAIEDLVGAAPETLNTLEELAAALQDNPDIIDDILQAIGLRATQADLNTLSGVVATKANTLATIENITANYELVVADSGKVKQCINTEPIEITLPADSIDLPIGAQIAFLSNGTDTVTFKAGTNATVVSTEAALTIAGQYSSAAALKIAADTWQLIGNLE
jgi:hypothetical protein